MSFQIFCLLILLNSLQTNARGRIPIGKNFKDNNGALSSAEHLDLPRGFDPQSPPTNPLLYPFVTAQPAFNKSKTTTGWRPIVTEKPITPSTSVKPLLQDRSTDSRESRQDVSPMPGAILETIVYGTWKPEPPVQPNMTLTKNFLMEKADNKDITASLENVLRGKLGGFIEDMGSKRPIPDSFEKSAKTISIESAENVSTSKQIVKRKLGRRKIISQNKLQSQGNQTEINKNSNSMEVIKVNATDPALLDMVKQINESVEVKSNKHSKERSSKQASKEWPTDFISSNSQSESQQFQESSIQDESLSYLDVSSAPPQAPKSHAPITSINITKMGIPYENLNSDEEASICVPLAVREPSVSNPAEIVEVERVYCFPLPATETKANIQTNNNSLIFEKEGEFEVLSYEELSSSSEATATTNARVNKHPIWLLGLIYICIK